MQNLPRDTRCLRLLLNGLSHVGPVTVRRLQEAFDNDLWQALQAGPSAWRKIKGITEPMVQSLEAKNFDWVKELAEVEKAGYEILYPEQAKWPQPLSQLWDPPLVLYAEGSEIPQAKSVAIIGSRHCSPYGAHLAHQVSHDLAKAGWWIISGMARGIDVAAHEGALKAGGRTAAILGHGLNLTYPPEAIKLRRQIASQGCLLSEFPLGRPADRQSFPQRNRLVAALVQAVVVVETDIDGGSMITARFAGDLGKTLCAFPGRVDNATSRGCHALIRDGATLVSSVDDILAELGETRGQLSLPLETMTPDEKRWLNYFRGGTIHDAESLSAVAKCSLHEAAGALTYLEIKGRLCRRSDGRHECQATI